MLLKDLLNVLDPFDRVCISIDYPDTDGCVCYMGDVVNLMVSWHDLTWDPYRYVTSLRYYTSSNTYFVMLSGR